jgi:hypothetical protein
LLLTSTKFFLESSAQRAGSYRNSTKVQTTMTQVPTPILPHSPLTAIIGKPTPATMAVLEAQMYANAFAIKFGGDPTFGLLSTILPAAAYAALPGFVAVFVPPVHPGAHPGHPPNPTGPQITELNRAHLAAEQRADAYANGVGVLKNSVLTAVEDPYLSHLSLPGSGYTHIDLPTIMASLHTEYGIVTGDMMAKNTALLNSEFTPSESMRSLWTRTKTCRELVANINPISELTAMLALMTVIEATGVFAVGCAAWRKDHPTTTTWTLALFQPHFDTANDERIRALTTGAAGFHGANAAVGSGPHLVFEDGTLAYYCWSHGITFSEAHTSKKCTNRCTGHKEEATATNLMGGCAEIFQPRRRPGPTAPGRTSTAGRSSAGRGGAGRGAGPRV